jgi:PRTRC genetic system ThiF family protein
MHIKKRYKLETGDFDRVSVVLAGCGGTGSFLALHLARLAYHVREQHVLDVEIAFVDPDSVETKNIGRQNFCPGEVGEHKAWALMRRYNAAFGLGIKAYNETFAPSPSQLSRRGHQTLQIIIGAVDNAQARRVIRDAVIEHDAWWLDCGNHEHSGQVLLGNREGLSEPKIDPMGFCSGLPLPSAQHPEILEETKAPSQVSCADNDAQSLMINQAMATCAALYLHRMIVVQDLDIYATYVDLPSGSMRSEPIESVCA